MTLGGQYCYYFIFPVAGKRNFFIIDHDKSATGAAYLLYKIDINDVGFVNPQKKLRTQFLCNKTKTLGDSFFVMPDKKNLSVAAISHTV